MTIHPLVAAGAGGDLDACARLMSSTEPWLTLGRTYDAALATLSDPAKEVHVARVDDELAGFIVLNMTGAFVGYIQTVCMAPPFRGRGLGSELIRWAERRIFVRTPNVFMCVSSFNQSARRLYERLGYQVVGELTDYIVAGHSELLLRKTIGPLSEWRRP